MVLTKRNAGSGNRKYVISRRKKGLVWYNRTRITSYCSSMGYFEGHKLKKQSGELVDAVEALQNKAVILVYFSAHWCPPCRHFTPVLKDCYEQLMDDGCEIAIVFVSSDRSEDEMNGYFKDHHGDWFVVPFDEKDLSGSLKKECNVTGIPKLVVVDKNGRSLYDGARSDVQETQPKLAFKKWKELYKA